MKNELINNVTYKNKMKTYCVKCRKRSKDLVKRTQSDKVLKDKEFKNLKKREIQAIFTKMN